MGVEKPSTSDSFSRMSNGDTWTSSGALDEVWQTEGGSDNLLTEVCALLSWKYSLGVRAVYGNWFGDSSRAQKRLHAPTVYRDASCANAIGPTATRKLFIPRNAGIVRNARTA